MHLVRAVVVALLLVAPVSAQEPVNPVLDALSYGTALVNPTIAAVQAIRSDHRWCKLGQLALSEAIGNTSTLTIKHFDHSPRPCRGCADDGNPSGHTMNSAIGMSSTGWAVGASFVWGTGALRHESNEHTWRQIALGGFIGILSDLAGHFLKCGA